MKKQTEMMIIVAIAIIAIAVIIYLMLKRDVEYGLDEYGLDEENGEPEPDPNPPYRSSIKFRKTVSYKKSITWDLEGEYYCTMVTGNFRPGGKMYTNVRIKVLSNNSWRHIGTEGGWPDGYTPFACTVNMNITKVKWEAEQGPTEWIPFVGELGRRYVDAVNAEAMVEI